MAGSSRRADVDTLADRPDTWNAGLPLTQLARPHPAWMMDGMNVEAIIIGTRDALGAVSSVHAIAGRGLEGDRHFFPDGAGPGRR